MDKTKLLLALILGVLLAGFFGSAVMDAAVETRAERDAAMDERLAHHQELIGELKRAWGQD